jgi:hypothetical protein
MPTKTDLPAKNKKDVSFEVERVIGSRTYKGKQQYLIKLVGLGSNENSWVDYDLMNCEKLVKEFEERKKKRQEKLKKGNIKDNRPLEKRGQKSSPAKDDKLQPQKGSPAEESKSQPQKGSPVKKESKSQPQRGSPVKEDKKLLTTPNKKIKSTIKEKVDPQTPNLKTKSDRINKLSPRKQKDFIKSVEDSEAMNKNKLLNGTLSNIQKKYNLPPNRNIPNTYDCIVDKVEGIITKNQRRLVQVLFIDGTRKEINLEIAKIGLPIHLINYYETRNQ